jgi:hypothetical protein
MIALRASPSKAAFIDGAAIVIVKAQRRLEDFKFFRHDTTRPDLLDLRLRRSLWGPQQASDGEKLRFANMIRNWR